MFPIVITHYVSPSKFWYKRVRAKQQEKEVQFQKELDQFCNEQHPMYNLVGLQYIPNYKEIGAVYDQITKKWCRCTVEKAINDSFEYRLWLLDEGVFRTVSSNSVIPIPFELGTEYSSPVKRGAIQNILPARCFFDPEKDELSKKFHREWCDCSNALLQSLIDNAEKIYFNENRQTLVLDQFIYSGNLLFRLKSGRCYDASKVLEEHVPWHGCIVDSDTYYKHFLEMEEPLLLDFDDSASTVGDGQDNISPGTNKKLVGVFAKIGLKSKESSRYRTSQISMPAGMRLEPNRPALLIKTPTETDEI